MYLAQSTRSEASCGPIPNGATKRGPRVPGETDNIFLASKARRGRRENVPPVESNAILLCFMQHYPQDRLVTGLSTLVDSAVKHTLTQLVATLTLARSP